MNKRFSESIEIDLRSDLPIYLQIIEQVKRQIADETLKPGDQLPTVRALAEELRINFNTVARSYRMLDEAGVISTQQGRGTYITEKPPPMGSEHLRRESLTALASRYVREARRLGFSFDEIRQYLQDQLEVQPEINNEGE
ncbi:MAG: GntR family transcriptional regulator [Chloroflexi bacterium]|nr:GntR family transcriptional regulator [Chloroflexota bacterium]